MAGLETWIRERVLYTSGFLQGRSYLLARGPSAWYAALLSKVTSFIALPLPLLSFLAVPFVGGSSTTLNLLIFYLTWSALVASHDPLAVELVGTLLVRVVCFLLPATMMLAFDCSFPKISQGIKARGSQQSPLQHGRDELLEIVAIAIFNVVLAVGVQGGCEYLATQIFHLRSLLRVSAAVPLPWTIAKDIAKGLVVRGVARYAIHRYLLHTFPSLLRKWHLGWQHSVGQPFSLVAAYDHPVNHLLSIWLPTFLPACVFRYHVLEWHLTLAIASFEELFVYSGYAVLPSGIVLPGMARRVEAHFDSVDSGKPTGNFGHLGILDVIFRTTCVDEADVVDDMQSEALKHQVQQRVEEAVQGALTGLQEQRQSSNAFQSAAADRPDVHISGEALPSAHATAGQDREAGEPTADDDEEVAADEIADGDQQRAGQRRSRRRKAAKA